MNREFLGIAGVASFGNTWQTDLASRLDVSDRTVRRWIKEDFMPEIKNELIAMLQSRKVEIDGAIDKLTNNSTDVAYQFDTHSQAVNFIKNYHIKMCGYKIHEPSHPQGVFAVVLKDGGNRVRLTVLDNRTIVKDSGDGKYSAYTAKVFNKDLKKYQEVIAMASQDE